MASPEQSQDRDASAVPNPSHLSHQPPRISVLRTFQDLMRVGVVSSQLDLLRIQLFVINHFLFRVEGAIDTVDTQVGETLA